MLKKILNFIFGTWFWLFIILVLGLKLVEIAWRLPFEDAIFVGAASALCFFLALCETVSRILEQKRN